MIINKLLIQKLVIAFLVAFFGALVVTLEGFSKETSFSWSNSVIISAIIGALSAGVRAVLALSPLNLTPSDAQHTLRMSRGTVR